MIPKPPANIATFFLRIPLSAMFLQQGLSKLPVDGAVAEAWGLPYIVWWFVTWGEIGAAVGLIVGGLFSLIPWYNKHFFITRLSTPYIKEVIYNIGDLITRFSGITMTCIATGVIWILSPDNIWDVIYKDYLHVSLYVGGLYFALRGNVKV
jgi:putative oxidoreductase|tara:strand:- start:4654 stop:5106 length:453 start_codon:yes stop_codon:yes gene_type:complete